MQTADFDHNVFNQAQSQADRSLRVKFYSMAVEDKVESKKKGRLICRDREMIEIMIPGQRQARVRAVDEAVRNRFREAYTRWKDSQEADEGMGTPLADYPRITRALVEELAYFNIKTVEQLALMADTQASQFMNGLSLKQEAEQWLENADKERPFLEMKAENLEMKSQLADMADVIKGLKGQIDDSANRGKNETQKKAAKASAKAAAEKALKEKEESE